MDLKLEPIILDYGKKDEKYDNDVQDLVNCKVFDVYFHNNDTRITMIRRGKCAYTFKLPDSRIKKGASAQLIYFINSDDARIVKQHNGSDVYVQA